MTFIYSICDPYEKEIIYKNSPLTGEEVLQIAKHYPWQEKLEGSEKADPNKVYYNPSLDFRNKENNRSFCLTAHFDRDKNVEFSFWYHRPKTTKVLFGLLGKKEKMVVDDVWGFNLEDSLQYLKHFINGEYHLIEALYN